MRMCLLVLLAAGSYSSGASGHGTFDMIHMEGKCFMHFTHRPASEGPERKGCGLVVSVGAGHIQEVKSLHYVVPSPACVCCCTDPTDSTDSTDSGCRRL